MNKQVALFLLPIIAMLLIGGAYSLKWWKSRTANVQPTPIPLSEGLKLEEDAESLVKDFGLSGLRNIQLKSVNGQEGTAVVSMSEDGKGFTVVATLPSVKRGEFYQVWMEKDGAVTLLGTMREGKGGYLFDYDMNETVSGSFKVKISKETKLDKVMETVIVEGEVKSE